MELYQSVFVRYLVVCAVCASVCASTEVTLSTSNGDIVGLIENVTFGSETRQVKKFLGIPFSEPMSASKRFERAVKRTAPFVNYNATFHRPICPQNEQLNKGLKLVEVSEDCLYLNVFTPTTTPPTSRGHAVMVWLYGGSFEFGGSVYYDGDVLTAWNDVIVVTLNYRVSVFGFLSSGDDVLPGNLGLWDQQLAIQWVHDNVAQFGGDVERITLFGESAGAASVQYQAVYPGNQGLFQRIVSQSGSMLCNWALERNPKEKFDKFVASVDCKAASTELSVDCLKGRSVEELTAAVTSMDRYTPVVDGLFLQEKPSDIITNETRHSKAVLQQFLELDFLTGVNNKDGASIIAITSNLVKDASDGIPSYVFSDFFLPIGIRLLLGIEDTPLLRTAILQQYTDWQNPSDPIAVRDNLIDFSSDASFFVPTMKATKVHADHSAVGKTYLYLFSQKFSFSVSPAWLVGAGHVEEIPYVFGIVDSLKLAYNIPKNAFVPKPTNEIVLSKKIMKFWTNFAKTGNPNTQETGSEDLWPEFSKHDERYIDITDNLGPSSVKTRLAASRMAFWENLVPSITSACPKCEDCTNNPISGTSNNRGQTVLTISVILALIPFI